jgi:deazaflavin-dependent oxidoreductase (nitroreductase family)
MTFSDARVEASFRQGFKYFNRFMLLLWRLGLGAWLNVWPEVGGRIMVVTHTGRKSGLRRRTPVNYALVDGELYCTAGFGSASDWYRNLLVNPNVEVWLPDGWWAGLAEDVSDCEQRLALMRQVIIASGIVGPLFGVDPQRLSDQELDQITDKYRLIRIRRTEARTGPTGPGDLAWVWPLATFLLLPLIWLRRKR